MAVALQQSQRVFSKIGYVGNFLGTDVELGNIYQLDDDQFVLLANLTELLPSSTLDGKKSTGSKTNLKFASESGVEVSFGANADLNLAKGEVLLQFKRAKSALVSLADVEVQQLKLALIKQDIHSVWSDQGFKRNGRHVLVSDVVTAASGTVVFTQQGGNRVVLKHTADESVASVAKLASGAFEIVTNSKGTLEIITTTPSTPMFKAVYPRKNGTFEILG